MCAACIEYTKDRLTTNELKSALRETTVDDRQHFEEVDKLIRESGTDTTGLKDKLKKLNQNP